MRLGSGVTNGLLELFFQLCIIHVNGSRAFQYPTFPIQAHSTSTATSCGVLQSSLAALSEQGMQAAGRQWVTEVGTFASQVGEFGFNQAGQLEHTQAVVDKYISEELVQDMPTGEPDSASLGTLSVTRREKFSPKIKKKI